MTIYFLINSPFPRYAGGIETWLFNISVGLYREYKINIVSHDIKYYPVLFKNIPAEIKIFKFKTLRSYRIIRPFIRSYLGLLDMIIGSYSMSCVLRKLIKEDDRCCIVALDSLFCVKAGLITRNKFPNIKIISSVRGPHAEIYAHSYGFFSKFIYTYEKKMLNQVDSIWANGYDTMALLKNRGFSSILMRNGVDYNKIILTNPSTEDLNYFEKDSINIVSVATLLPIKGIFELIKAISILKRGYFLDVNVYFIGKGNQKTYKLYAIDLKIDKYVHFLGHKDNPSIFIKQSDIAVCLSGGSGMSMAALEAMACGVPIIAWDTPVYQQFNQNHPTMFLVKEKDAVALANGIIEIINNYDKYLKIASGARLEAKSYDWVNICDEFIANLNRS